jgi:hypothetical protein
MSESAIVAPFKGLWRRQSATSPEGKATSMLNAYCVTEGDLRPRYGYRTLSNRPAGVTEFFPRGFAYLQGYDADFDGLREFVTVENRDGTIRPYSVDLSTGVRTVITDGGTALSLPDGMYQGVAYDDRSYWINPSANTPLYRHQIGNIASWDTLVDTAYVAPPVSPAFTVTPLPASNRNINDAIGFDTITVTAPDGISGAPTITTAVGVLEVSGPDDDNGAAHRTRTQIAFFASEDWSQHGYIAVEVLAGVVYPFFERTNLSVEVLIGATWTALPTKELFNGTSTKVLIMARLRGIAGIGAVLGIRFSIGGYVARGTNGLAYKVNPIKLAGSFLEATSTGVRLWDGTSGDGLEYAVRYCGAGGIAPLSAITRNSVNELAAAGELLPDYSVRLGGRLALSVPEADAGTYSHVEFLRQNQAKTKWHRIGIQPNSGTAKMTDVIEDHELTDPPYTEVVLGSGGSTGARPPFSTRGIVAVFYYRGRLIWLRKGGKDNISLSRVGEPEETYDANNIPSLLDVGRPVDLSMSPDLTDEPIGGAEVGNGAIFVGNRGLYAMTGVTAAEIESPARIPGSTGGCGRFAYSKCIIQGQPGLAVMDKSGSVWFVTVEGAFSGDASVRPVDLTFDLWKWTKTFLYDEQRDEFSMLDLSTIWMQWDEFDQALWVGAGRRALVLRVAAERPEWEPYEYALVNPSGELTETFCIGFEEYGRTAETRNDGDKRWITPVSAIAEDGLPTTCGALSAGNGILTDTLRVTNAEPESIVPIGATVLNYRVRIKRSRSGGHNVLESKVQPLVAGANLGANLSAGRLLTGTPEWSEYVFATLPTVAQINAGDIGFDLQYTQQVPGTVTIPLSLTHGTVYPWIDAGIDMEPGTTVRVRGSGSGLWGIYPVNAATPDGDPAFPTPGNYMPASASSDCPAITCKPFSLGIGLGTDVQPEWFEPDGGGGGIDEPMEIGGGGGGGGGTGGSSTYPPTIIQGGTAWATFSSGVGGKLWLCCNDVHFAFDDNTGAWNIEIEYTPRGGATVAVDAVQTKVCYEIAATTQETSGGIGWQLPVFTSDRQKLMFRTSGQIDEVEFNSSLGSYMAGTNRDGGRPMPEGHWRSRLNILERTRIKHVEIEEQDPSALTITVDAQTKAKGADVRWAKFGVLSQGHQQEVGIKFSESTQSIKAMRVIYEMLNKRLSR